MEGFCSCLTLQFYFVLFFCTLSIQDYLDVLDAFKTVKTGCLKYILNSTPSCYHFSSNVHLFKKWEKKKIDHGTRQTGKEVFGSLIHKAMAL